MIFRCVVGRIGESFYKLSDLSHEPNYDHMCRVWYGREDTTDTFDETLACPCNRATVKADARWRPDGIQYPDGKTCFYERMPSKLATQVGDNGCRGSDAS